MVVIGFSGKMGTGKNYIAETIFAKYLTDNNESFLIMAFADQLKIEVMSKYDLSYTAVFNDKTADTRAILQKEGTELGRNFRGHDVWIKYVANWMEIYKARGIKHFLITDVRFKNEAEWIKSIGGKIINISAIDRHQSHCVTRGLKSQTHQSETDLDLFDISDFKIDNSFENSKKINQQCLEIASIILTSYN